MKMFDNNPDVNKSSNVMQLVSQKLLFSRNLIG